MQADNGLRVLWMTPSFAPRRGGVETHVLRVGTALQAAGIDLQIATPCWEPDWFAQEMVAGLPVTRLPLQTSAGRKTLAPLVRHAQIVHTHDAYPFLKYYLPFRFTQPHLPTCVTFHGFEGYPIPLEARVLRRVVLGLTKGSICAGAFIPKWYKFNCEYITHGGVDCPEQMSGEERQDIVYAGRLEPDTGFLEYLKAFQIAHEQGLDGELIILGDGSLRVAGEQFAAQNKLPVKFQGRVADVSPWLAKAKVSFVSGLLGMLEAMAQGAVVIALYDNPLKEDYLRLSPQGAYAKICKNAEEAAQQLFGIIQNDDSRIELTKQAFEFVQTQTWERVAQLYIELYHHIRKGR